MSTHELPEPAWTIDETVLSNPDLPDSAHRDSVFALQNGRFGCKGTRPGTEGGHWGTIVWRLLDSTDAYDHELALTKDRWITPIVPNLWHSTFPGAQTDALERFLDMKNGVLVCRGRIDTGQGAWNLESIRFLSWADRRVAAERIILEPINGTGSLSMELSLDDSVRQRKGRTFFDAWRHRTHEAREGLVVWQGATLGSGHVVTVAVGATCNGEDLPATAPCGPGLRLETTERVVIDRFVGLDSSLQTPEHASSAEEACRAALRTGFDECLGLHRAEVARFWDIADIEIDGPLYDQRATRSCVFQIGGATPDSSDYSFGAKLLAGPHYNAQVFWDVDLFILPYLTRVFPEAALRHLEFRHRGLIGAREKAREFGYEGAMYPWNAGPDDGREATSSVFGNKQIHITADVAWGVIDYLDWTRDEQFFEEKGWEILADCARFWAGRVEADGGIRHVIGPDERAIDVDNNAFTNHMAGWVLEQAADRCTGKVTSEELSRWRTVAERIIQQQPNADGLVEQYDGYLQLPQGSPDTDSELSSVNDHHRPSSRPTTSCFPISSLKTSRLSFSCRTLTTTAGAIRTGPPCHGRHIASRRQWQAMWSWRTNSTLTGHPPTCAASGPPTMAACTAQPAAPSRSP